MATIDEIRKLKHLEYQKILKEKEDIEKAIRLKEQEIFNRLDDIIMIFYQCLEDLGKATDYIYCNMVISTFYNTLKENIDFLKEHKKVEMVQGIFFDLINKMNDNELLRFNVHSMQLGEKQQVDNTIKGLNFIMDLLGIDQSIIDIKLMDTSNDLEYASKIEQQQSIRQTNRRNYISRLQEQL
jgi:hypothetical protein